jgi:hypothetical protein
VSVMICARACCNAALIGELSACLSSMRMWEWPEPHTCRVGQNRIYTYIYTVYLVISKPKIPYVHRMFWPTLYTCNKYTKDWRGKTPLVRLVTLNLSPNPLTLCLRTF